MLRIEGITKQFGSLRALEKVSMEVPDDQITGLIGPNGAGKTTLFNVITGFLQPEAGKVEFSGNNIVGLSPENICRLGIARTFQLVKTFDKLTVEKNVAIGALKKGINVSQAHERAVEILEEFNMGELKSSKVSNLTLCGRKKVELCRAFATSPELLLLDEVMSGLNPTEIEEIKNIIRKTFELGSGIFLIEHIMDAIMDLSDEVFVINEGQNLANGEPKEIAQNRDVVTAYLGEEYNA